MFVYIFTFIHIHTYVNIYAYVIYIYVRYVLYIYHYILNLLFTIIKFHKLYQKCEKVKVL